VTAFRLHSLRSTGFGEITVTSVGLSAEKELAATVGDRVEMLRRLGSVGRGLLAALIGLTVVEGLIPAATAVAFAALVSRVGGIANGAAAAAIAPLVAYLVILLAAHALAAVREPLSFLAQARIDGDHRARVARLAAMSDTIGALERPEVQALIWQTRADPESFIEATPGPGVLTQLELLGRVLAMVTSGAILAAYTWWLLPLLVVPALVVQNLYAREARQRRRVWRASIAPGMHAEVWADAITSAGEGKEVRIFGLAGWAVDRIQHYVRRAFDPIWAQGRRALFGLWRPALLVLVPLGVAYLSVTVEAVGRRTSVAVAAAVFAAAATVFQALAESPHFTIGTVTILKAFDRLSEALAPDVRPDTANLPPAAETAPLIRFEDIGFHYPGSDRQVLDRLDLEIRPGELLGVVGLNGAGKSTLIKLLAWLYEPTSGRITADGVDLAGVDPAAWRTRMSVVFQDFVRYDLSVADNVALGSGVVPRDERAMAAAARDSGLEDLLDRLPAGWDTPLSRSRSGGVDLSGGQWQQVVLARALYAVHTGSQVLVLDEPTAHLDVRTEFDVFDRLAAHKGDATVVLISHRLSTVRQSDRIVLLSDGRITESGSHDELMALGGAYAGMFGIQAERFRLGYDDRIEEGDLA
jgi:ABC-type multidrug transport system fused ATPase/permease subunit